MDKKIKKRWVKALRKSKVNGKPIVQAKRRLRVAKDDKGRMGLCCLGVLCELARAEGVVTVSKNIDGEFSYNGETGVLPSEVVRWAGLDGKNPDVSVKFDDERLDVALSELNDDCEESFESIAEKIEKQL